jgi:REP element-mobilizing transposase RayT
MTSTFANLVEHVVFSTKNREALIAAEIAGRLYSFIGGIARNRRCVLLAAGGMPDHIHLLVSLHPTVAPATLIRDV